MTARRQVPGETAHEPRPFRARSGDTVPESIIPGFAVPGSATGRDLDRAAWVGMEHPAPARVPAIDDDEHP